MLEGAFQLAPGTAEAGNQDDCSGKTRCTAAPPACPKTGHQHTGVRLIFPQRFTHGAQKTTLRILWPKTQLLGRGAFRRAGAPKTPPQNYVVIHFFPQAFIPLSKEIPYVDNILQANFAKLRTRLPESLDANPP